MIDECHRLSAAAWTVLLKPIEESPQGLFWFVCTTDLARVPKNVRSRCVLVPLQDVGRNDLVDLLRRVARREKWSTPTDVLALCAQEARGAPRNALILLAACSQCTTRQQAARLINAAMAQDDTPNGLGYRLAQALKYLHHE